MSTDEEWRAKCQNLKRKIILVEESNQLSSVAISRAKMAVNRLRLEYSILLERLEKKAILSESESEESDLEITEGKKILKRKKPSVPQPRDPDMPKRPINPYLVFCEMEKDRLKREAEAEGKEIDLSKTLGEIWRSMDAEKRQPYVDIFNEDRERYNKQMNEYENRNTKKQKVDAKTEETSVEP